MTLPRRHWRTLRPLVVVIALAASVPPIVSLLDLAHHRTHTYETRSLHTRRSLDLRWERDYQYEATFEKCEIQSMDQLARTYGVPANPTAVARAYARRHAPAVREVVFKGCRDAYLERWNPPKN